MADIEAALKPLLEARFVHRSRGLRGAWHYELAHDFLVRAVVRRWQLLAERRKEERIRYVQSQGHSRALLKALSGIALRVRGLLIGESVVRVVSVWMLPVFWLVTGSYPQESLRHIALVCPLMLALSGLFLGCWPATLQGLLSALGIASLPKDAFFRENAWSVYMIHLVVITIYLAMGTASWSARLSEKDASKLEWKKIAATSFDYASILILMGGRVWYRVGSAEYTLAKGLILSALLGR